MNSAATIGFGMAPPSLRGANQALAGKVFSSVRRADHADGVKSCCSMMRRGQAAVIVGNLRRSRNLIKRASASIAKTFAPASPQRLEA